MGKASIHVFFYGLASFGKGRKRGRMMVTWHGLEAWLMKQVAEQRRTEASK